MTDNEYKHIGKIQLEDLSVSIGVETALKNQRDKERCDENKMETIKSYTTFVNSVLPYITKDNISSSISKAMVSNQQRIVLFSQRTEIGDYLYHGRDDLISYPINKLKLNHGDLVTPDSTIDYSKSIIQIIEDLIPEGFRVYYGYNLSSKYYMITLYYDSICNDPLCYNLWCGSQCCNSVWCIICWYTLCSIPEDDCKCCGYYLFNVV